MIFKDVPVGYRFSFEETGFECIKTGARKYKFESADEWWITSVGTIDVLVTNVREAYDWELEAAGLK